MWLLLIITVLFAGYAWLLRFYRRAWKAVPHVTPRPGEPLTRVSVVVAARNEEENVRALVESLKRQRYPEGLWEVILVDDGSEDGTAERYRQASGAPGPGAFRIVRLEGAAAGGKKKALAAGIAAARGELIVTTDADCTAGPDWLRNLVLFYEQERPVFIAAPVVMQGGYGLLHRLQELDFLVLQGITAASVQAGAHSLCNGANLAYRRSVFYEVNGFEGIDHIASGDDLLLMHKISGLYPGKARYLLSSPAIVHTGTEKSWGAFFRQRIRWGSKTRFYTDQRILWVMVLVFGLNLSFPVLAVAAFGNVLYLWALLVLLLLKTAVEWPFVQSVSRFYGKEKGMRWFLLLQPVHMLYMVSAGVLSQIGSYRWKGRNTK